MTWRYTVFRNELRVMPLEKASCRKKKRHAARKSVMPQEKASCRKTKRHAARKSVMSQDKASCSKKKRHVSCATTGISHSTRV